MAFSVAEPECVSFLSLSRLGNEMVEFRGSANDWVVQTNDDSHDGTGIIVVCA